MQQGLVRDRWSVHTLLQNHKSKMCLISLQINLWVVAHAFFDFSLLRDHLHSDLGLVFDVIAVSLNRINQSSLTCSETAYYTSANIQLLWYPRHSQRVVKDFNMFQRHSHRRETQDQRQTVGMCKQKSWPPCKSYLLLQFQPSSAYNLLTSKSLHDPTSLVLLTMVPTQYLPIREGK